MILMVNLAYAGLGAAGPWRPEAGRLGQFSPKLRPPNSYTEQEGLSGRITDGTLGPISPLPRNQDLASGLRN